MATRITQNTFAGGEISPALIARNDIQKYSSSLKTLRNGFIRQEGCVTNRSGLEFCCEVKNSDKKVRLIPFVFNQEQSYIIEFGEYYFRVIYDGGYITYPDDYSDSSLRGEIFEGPSPYSAEELRYVDYYQEMDILKLVHHGYPPKQLVRYSNTNWQISNISYAPSISAPTNIRVTWTGSTENHTRDYSYLVTAVDKNTLEESNRSEIITTTGHSEGYWLADEYMTIKWNSVSKAIEYNVYREVNGIYAYIGTSEKLTFVDKNIEPDLANTAPINQTPFDNNNNPCVVGSYQQRNFYANSINNPLTIWGTQTATNNNFNVSRPTVASDAITMTLFDNEASEIRHIITLDDMIVLTSNAEWKISGSDGSMDATPPPKASIQSRYGSSFVKPIVSGNMILFVQSGGMVVRDLGYTYMSDSYDGDELTIFANHLFLGKEIIYMAYSKEPFRLLWVVFDDGTLAGLTYNKKQEHCGWHRHDSGNGKFESVAVIRENNEDIPYFVVNRTINGQTKRYIERLTSRIVSSVSDGMFLDSSLKYSGTPVYHLTGLDHLEGEKITVMADGGVVQNLEVENGSVDLPYKASNIVAGLPYTFEVETLNIEGENTHCLKKNISRIDVKIFESREDFKCVSDDGTKAIAPRSLDSVNDSELLLTTEVSFVPRNLYTSNANIHLIQDEPLPLTITAISAVVNAADIV